MAFELAGRQQADALVLSTEPTRNGDRWKVQIQILGAGVEVVFPTLEEARALGLKEGVALKVDIQFVPHGQGESTREKDDKTYTERFPTYRMKVYLPRSDAGAVAEEPATRRRAAS